MNCNFETREWNWSLENGLAVLREPFRPDARYDEANIKFAIANVKANRATYATVEAWERHLRMLEYGAALFCGGGD